MEPYKNTAVTQPPVRIAADCWHRLRRNIKHLPWCLPFCFQQWDTCAWELVFTSLHLPTLIYTMRAFSPSQTTCWKLFAVFTLNIKNRITCIVAEIFCIKDSCIDFFFECCFTLTNLYSTLREDDLGRCMRWPWPEKPRARFGSCSSEAILSCTCWKVSLNWFVVSGGKSLLSLRCPNAAIRNI